MNIKVDISNVIIKTERLTLRGFELSDLDDFYEYASVDGVGQMAGWLPHKNKEESLTILKRFIESKKVFAILYNNKTIGSIGIEEYKDYELPEFQDYLGREIGYVLSKDYWGNGFMTEAVRAVINYCFNNLKVDFLVCGAFVDNIRSIRVQEKCEFVFYKNTKYITKYNEIKNCKLSILKR